MIELPVDVIAERVQQGIEQYNLQGYNVAGLMAEWKKKPDLRSN